MSFLLQMMLIVTGLFMLPGFTYSEELGPSAGAVNMPGAKGVFAFRPVDWSSNKLSWWKDSDGVEPGVAGCHIGVSANGKPNGRTFGEACLPGGRILVESNPGKDVVHSHNNDTGFPDTFDCRNWCMSETGTSGQCIVAAAPPCEVSARCLCDVELNDGNDENLIEASNELL